MQHIELQIRWKDWLFVLVIAILFSTLLSAYTYFLVGENISNSFWFGTLLGSVIFLFAIVFIYTLNNYVLPKLAKKYWLILAIILSFLSGFLGTLLTYNICTFFELSILDKFKENYFTFALIIGVLTYFVAALLYAFVSMSNKKEYNEKLLLDSRLKSLQRQLNPHFLYNSLNSTMQLIYQDKNKAEESLIELSKFLRQSMKESALISLKNEVENLKRYVKLENIRFSNKIVLNLHIKEHLLEKQIPKFSLQLLVENAIKHGFKDHTKELIIDISMQQENPFDIFVKNSGKSVEDSSFGIGLRNLQERLNILCRGDIELIDKKDVTYKIRLGECDENINNG